MKFRFVLSILFFSGLSAPVGQANICPELFDLPDADQTEHTFPGVLSEVPADGIVSTSIPLNLQNLVKGYRDGYFFYHDAWYASANRPEDRVANGSRGIVEIKPGNFSDTLMQNIWDQDFYYTIDARFEEIIRGSAAMNTKGRGESWVTPEIVEYFLKLHEAGLAHSVEVWKRGRVVGGVYGVQIEGMFGVESAYRDLKATATYVKDKGKMNPGSHSDYASKAAFVHLYTYLAGLGHKFIDVQVVNQTSGDLGGIWVSRQDFLRRLAESRVNAVPFKSPPLK